MDLEQTTLTARLLMKKHGLIDQGWKFKFDSSVKRFGQCSYRSKTISLSRKLTLLNPEKEVVNTILHEIAHALTPLHHHDGVWKAKAAEIGARPERCYSTEQVTAVPKKYVQRCPSCEKVTPRHRVPRKGLWVCGPCKRERKQCVPLEYYRQTGDRLERIK